MSRRKILFLIGSLNQTTQMHQVADALPEYDCFFSQLYSDHRVIKWIIKKGWLDRTIVGGIFKRQSDKYIAEHGLRNDYAASVYNNQYDLAVCCTDLIVPLGLRKIKTVFIQEGMTDPVTTWAKITRRLKLPAITAMNTAYNGCNNICDIYCAASEGYRQQFIKYGTAASRIFVTGIPNYDNIAILNNNDFPYRDYVLVATSDIRELGGRDNRAAFISRCVQTAAGRQLIFKLHPNENQERATAEINSGAPGALVFAEGNTGHMIANCEELITQYSTVVYMGIALGKKVHSYFDVAALERLTPVQNGGTSARNIAAICRSYIEHTGSTADFLRTYKQQQELKYA
jgi:hypothetical protein